MDRRMANAEALSENLVDGLVKLTKQTGLVSDTISVIGKVEPGEKQILFIVFMRYPKKLGKA